MLKKLFLLTLVITIIPYISFASGPNKVAKSDRSLWPYEINTPQGFDKASKYEILAFIKTFDAIENQLKTEDDIKNYVGRDKVSVESVEKYKALTKIKFSKLYSFFYVKDNPEFVNRLPFMKISPDFFWYKGLEEGVPAHLTNSPDELKPWMQNSEDFYQTYIYEQIRLAALFPNITSEIDVLDDSEIKDIKHTDKQFILTFDDGPTAKAGNTDRLINTLKANDKGAIFFVLGDNLVKRNDTKELYDGFILASHGKEHKVHTKKEFFEDSINFTAEKITQIYPNQKECYFRPPYGQRSIDTIKFLKKKKCSVLLWDIDSQDWSSKMTAKEVKDRVITLMLLKRSGIILFHDIHRKANDVLPMIWSEFDGSGAVIGVKNIKDILDK